MSYLEIYNESLFDLLAPGGVNVTDDLIIIDDPKVKLLATECRCIPIHCAPMRMVLMPAFVCIREEYT
jgi:hypothetical protein